MVRTLAISLDDTLADDLAVLCQESGQSIAWHVQQAVVDYLAERTAFLRAVDEGLADAAAGNLVDHAEARLILERAASRPQG